MMYRVSAEIAMLSYYGRVDESKLSNDRGDMECTVILHTVDNKVSKAVLMEWSRPSMGT